MASLKIPVPGRRFVISVPYVWLVLFFFLPFLILLYISFVDMGNDIHPFKPIWDTETGVLKLKYENYWSIFRRDDGGLDSFTRQGPAQLSGNMPGHFPNQIMRGHREQAPDKEVFTPPCPADFHTPHAGAGNHGIKRCRPVAPSRPRGCLKRFG